MLSYRLLIKRLHKFHLWPHPFAPSRNNDINIHTVLSSSSPFLKHYTLEVGTREQQYPQWSNLLTADDNDYKNYRNPEEHECVASSIITA
jgi:hypothetical protein